MSKYGRVKTEMTDEEILMEAINRSNPTLARRAAYYPQGNGQYYTWKRSKRRGTDACIVIGGNGGLDTTGNFCGDTAFVREPDGTLRCEIDIAHGNAALNWQLIQNHYAAIGLERQARARGFEVEISVNPVTGKISGKVLQMERAIPGREVADTQRRAGPSRVTAMRR